jgi:hypothetical protein
MRAPNEETDIEEEGKIDGGKRKERERERVWERHEKVERPREILSA